MNSNICTTSRLLLLLAISLLISGCSTRGLISSQSGIGGLLGATVGAIAGDSVAKQTGLDSGEVKMLGGIIGATVGSLSGASIRRSADDDQKNSLPPLRQAAALTALDENQMRINALHDAIKNESKWQEEQSPHTTATLSTDEEEAYSQPYQGISRTR